MPRPLELPEGYDYRAGRDEFGDRCFTLFHPDFGDLSDHACEAGCFHAAQEHAEGLAEEAADALAAAADHAASEALTFARAA